MATTVTPYVLQRAVPFPPKHELERILRQLGISSK